MFELKKTISLSAALLLATSLPLSAETAPAFTGFNEVLGMVANSEGQGADPSSDKESSHEKGQAQSNSNADESSSVPEDSSNGGSTESRDEASSGQLRVPESDSKAFQDLRKKMMAAKGQTGREKQPANKSIHDMTREELSTMVKEKNESRIKERMQSVFKSNSSFQLDSGENRIAPISLGNFNRFVTPFEDPKVYSTCPESTCKSFVEKNVVFFATADKKPRGLFISPSDDPSVSISLTVKPDALINPQEYSIDIIDYAPAVAPAANSDPEAATDFEGMGQSEYMTWVRETFDILARGEIPPGYSVGDPDASMSCQLEGFDMSPGQVLNGARFRIDVYRVSNPAGYVQQVSESSCFEKGVKFVFTLPNPKLSPGDSLELFVMRTKPKERFNLRPKLVGNR